MYDIRSITPDQVLTGVSIAYKNDNYISRVLMPVYNSEKDKGIYYKYDKANLRRNKTDRARGGKSNEVDSSLTSANFATTDHALKEKIPFEEMDQAPSPLNPETDTTEIVTDMLLIDEEVALAATMADTAVITQNVTLSGTSQWSDYTNSDPFDDITTAKSAIQVATGKAPNHLILSQTTFDVLIMHPDIVDRIKYTGAGSITPDMLARLFNVEKCVVGSAIYNTAKEGQTDATAFVWGKHAWLVYIAPGTGLKQVTFGWTISYKGRSVVKWDDQDAKSRFVRVNDEYTKEIAAVECAYLIKNAVA